MSSPSPEEPGLSLRLTTVLIGVLLAVACEHTDPYAPTPWEGLGPKDSTDLRRLTFNPGPDETPSGRDQLVVFSRGEFGRVDGDQCLAFLPAEGGTLLETVCPGGGDPDDRMEVATEPAISPDGTRVAYVYARGSIGELVPQRRIVVAPVDAPDAGTEILAAIYTLQDGRRISDFRHLTWADEETLWVVAGWDAFQDEVPYFEPRAVLALSVSSATPTEIPVLSGAGTYARAGNGGVWFVRDDERGTDSSVVRYADPGAGTTNLVAELPGRVVDLADLGGRPLALLSLPNGDDVLLVLDPETGERDSLPLSGLGTPLRVSVAATADHHHALLEVRPAGAATSDIWLLELP